MSKVTVAVVSLNHLDGLKRTLASVEAQQGPPFEIVVVDGGSSDGTADWLATHVSRHALHWTSEADSGIYNAMNKAASRASGDLIIYLNAGDCFASPVVVSTIVGSQGCAKWEWAYGCTRVLGEDRQVVSAQAFVPFSPLQFRLGLKTVCHQAVVMRRELILALNGFRENFGLAADQELILRALMHSNPTAVAEFFVNYEGGGVSAGRAVDAAVRDMWRARRLNQNRVGGNAIVDGTITGLLVAWRRLLACQTRLRRRWNQRLAI